jgi:origin recognition complex subunit 3
MEYEKCYVYEPESKRPTKRRKTEHQGLHASWKLRHQAYEAAWEERKAKIDVLLHSDVVSETND